MSKKKKTDILSHFEIFKRGAKLNNIDTETATEIFNLIEKFAGYGFNKAHSVGYSILTYNSAWLKVHYNIFFMVSLLSSDMDNDENTKSFINDCEYFSIKILEPDINRSFYSFTTIGHNQIRYGFGAIKGIGKSVISEIIYNRSVFGSFNSFFDFLYRLNVEILSKRVLESLVYSGCFKKINILKFKLVLVSAKVFDLYIKIKKTISSDDVFLDNYFNYFLKDFNYIVNYRQNEFREVQKLLSESLSKNIMSFYLYESKILSRLSFASGVYINKIFCGIVKNIIIKNNNVNLIVHNTFEKQEILFSYQRYKNTEKILKKYNLVTIAYYTRNNVNHELFAENFYLFRYKFIKYIDILLVESYISEHFIIHLIKNIYHFVKGCSILRFKIPFKGAYKIIKVNTPIYIYLHDNSINELLKFKEVKGLKLIYKF